MGVMQCARPVRSAKPVTSWLSSRTIAEEGCGMLKNPNPISFWQPGMYCWYYEPSTERVLEGRIIASSRTSEKAIIEKGILVDIERPLDTLFMFYEDAQAAICAIHAEKQADYEAGIKTVQELLQFSLDHTLSKVEDDYDADARAAYVKRAKELLGVEL